MKGISEEQKILLDQGKMLPIMEHFYTIQGEGAHSGKAAYFIRLAGCDVGCHWCDVKESWEADKHPIMDSEEIAIEAAKHSKTIIITGGEPLMWNLEILTKKLKDLGCVIHIETSGSSPLSGYIDWITLSPKKRKLPLPEVYERANELKMIIFNKHDFIFAEEEAKKVSSRCELYLQTEWSKREENYPKITEYILKNPKWRASIQTHKYMDIP